MNGTVVEILQLASLLAKHNGEVIGTETFGGAWLAGALARRMRRQMKVLGLPVPPPERL
jgi:hypothetical protein